MKDQEQENRVRPPPQIPRLRAVPAPEVLARFLRDEILADRLPAGTTLPSERELAQQSGFGRSTVREAVKMLSAEGVVAMDGPDRRLVVTQPTTSPLRRVFESFVLGRRITLGALIEARLLVEPEASSLAARAKREPAIKSLRQATLSLEQAETEEEFIQHTVAWHKGVATATGNEVIESLVEVITYITHTGGSPFYWGSQPAHVIQGVHKAHRKILSAIEKGDSDLAKSAMVRHLNGYRLMASRDGALDRTIQM
jgi:DNA-binding FadR family transcriptional regulator